MIVYVLSCENGHQFDAWFRDSDAFDAQQREGALSCPNCASRSVAKMPSAPHVARGRGAGSSEAEEGTAATPEAVASALTQLRQYIESNCEYVGAEFAEQARRIHYGEMEKRDIYGEATLREEAELRSEGVTIQAIPWLVRRDG